MRELVDASRVHVFMRALSQHVRGEARVYFTGGTTALLFGWRATTIDIDVHLVPDTDEVLRAINRLKDELDLNLELACPSHFIPALPGWQDRSLFIAQERRLTFLHYDPYSQALAKIERSHPRDLIDVREMLARSLVRPDRLRELFTRIEPDLFRYPAVDPARFGRAVDAFAPA